MAGVELRVLGPLELMVDGRPFTPAAPKQRSLLAFLAVHVGEVQSTDRILDALWGEVPPEGGVKTLRYHVSKLRAELGSAGSAVETHSPGYALAIQPEAVDGHRFEMLVREAQALLRTHPVRASQLFDEAVGMWRGSAYADFPYEEFVQVEARRLEEMRLAAIEDRGRAHLVAGRHRELASEFEALVAEHPLRERMVEVLMVALYRAGRQADALRHGEQLRRMLLEEAGLDPSPEFKALEQHMLDQDAVAATGDPFAATAPEARVPVRNPFKGLRPFTEADAEDFYGRSDLVLRMAERLAEPGRTGRLLVVAGPSGSGKSSLVRAGLVPALRHGAAAGSREWRIDIMYPGSDAVAQLTRVLDDRPDSEPRLLIIDQFEELFILSDTAACATYLAILENLVTGDRPVRVVCTLRADFMDRPLSFPSFGRLVEAALMLVTPLADDDVRSAAVEPAASVGVRAEPELAAAMIGDVASRAATLPLLQYTLTDLFEHRRGERLTLDAYRASGGISGALARRADHTYLDLDPREREATRQVFLRLVTFTSDGEHLRRRVAVEELTSLPIDAGSLDHVLDRFGRQRLLTFDRDDATGRPTVEVAHEALLREWPRLWDWVETNRDDIRSHRRLVGSVADWEEADRDPGFLPTGTRLIHLQEWAKSTTLALSTTERAYLDAATGHAEEQHRRIVRQRRSVTATLLLAALIATTLAMVALAQRNRAQGQTAVAEQQIRITTARELAGAARANLAEDPELSMLLTLDAIDVTRAAGEPAIGEAVGLLHEAVLAGGWKATLPGAEHMAWSPDGSQLLTQDPDAPDETAVVVDRATGEVIHSLDGSIDATTAAWSPDGRLIATGDERGPTVLWDAATGDRLPPLAEAMQDQWGLTFNRDGALLAGRNVRNSTVTVVDTATGTLVMRIGPGSDDGSGIAFRPDGEVIATVAWEATTLDTEGRLEDAIELRTVPEGHLVANIGPAPLVRWITFSPDGEHIAGVSATRTLHIWDVDSGEELVNTPEAGDGPPAWSPDGATLAVPSGTRVEVWNTTTGEREPLAYDHPSQAMAVSYSPTGQIVATASATAVRLWGVSHLRGEVAALPGDWRAVNWMPEGSRLVAADGDGALHLFDLATEEQLGSVADAGHRVVVSPDGRFIAAAGEGVEPALVLDSDTLQRVAAPTPGKPLAVSPDGSELVIGSVFGKAGVTVYDTASWREVFGLDIGAVAAEYLPDGEHLLLSTQPGQGTTNGAGVLWDLEAATETSRLPLPGRGLPGGVSANGTLIAVGENETGYIGVWDADALLSGARPDQALLKGLAAPPDLRGLVLSHDGAQIFAAGERQLTVIDVETGDRSYGIDFDAEIREFSVSSDGRYLAFATEYGLHVITTDLDELIDIAEDRIGRAFTSEECRSYLHVEECPTA